MLALPKWSASIPSTPLQPHPGWPSASGELNSYHAGHREYVRPPCHLGVSSSFFLHSPTSTPLPWNQGSLSPVCFFYLGDPRGQAVLHLVTPKAKSLATSPFAREVPTPLLSVSAQLCFSWGFQGSRGWGGERRGQPLSLCRQLTRP